MMSYLAELDALAPDLRVSLAAVEILSESCYRVDGKIGQIDEDEGGRLSSGQVDQSCTDVSPSKAERSPLEAALANEIYFRLYCRQSDRSVPRLDPILSRRHLGDLSAANSGQGTWEAGWRIRRLEKNGWVWAKRQGVGYLVAPQRLRCGDGGPAVDDLCRVRVPKESLHLIPGFYLARGDAEAASQRADFVVRLYWHLRPSAAAPWVAALTRGLNQRAIPFSLKTLHDPRFYSRADAGVLYLQPHCYEPARDEILQTWHEVGGDLLPTVPRLTIRLAPGLGLAEGPSDGSSFGEHRCGLIAAALVRAFEEGRNSPRERAEAVAATFQVAGLDPARPHLAPGSTSSYSLDVEAMKPSVHVLTLPSMSLSETACRIGDALCREAFWYNGRCTWLGHTLGAREPTTGRQPEAVATLPGDLYVGTSGIGLFLAQLHMLTHERVHRRTALAAFAQALAKISETAERYPPLAFYDGGLGVAWAARRVAVLLRDAGLEARAKELIAVQLATLEHEAEAERRIDLLSGNAGGALALLDLHLATAQTKFLEGALALGEEMLRQSVQQGDVWTWKNDLAMGLEPSNPPLTGFAHGAAGIGLALLALFRASGQQSFLEAARGAFAYEDALFDDEHNNWPDLRSYSPAEGDEGEGTAPPPPFMTAWCHGAPGVALSRLCAIRIDPRRARHYEVAARIGLETTERALDAGLAIENSDVSLCHGLCGFMEVLLTGAEILQETTLRRTAQEAARRFIDRRVEHGDWPSGMASKGRSPSLFVGEAGVGYTLLRLVAPEDTPSILVPGGMTMATLLTDSPSLA